MNTRQRTATGILAVGLITTLSAWGLTIPANAAGDASEEIASVVAAATGADEQLTTPQPDGFGGLVADNETVTATATVGGEPAVALSFDGATPLNVGLPLETATERGSIASDGTLAYAGIANSADVSVQVLDESVRIATVVDDASQSSTFTYSFDSDTTPIINPDGSVDIYKLVSITDPDTGDVLSADVLVAQVSVPWAKDSAGDDVGTHFEAAGNSLVQVVDHRVDGVDYPVVADPQITQPNIFQYLVRWNRAETATIASAGWGATGLTAVCALIGAAVGGPPGAAIFAAACLAVSASGVYTAGVAQNSNPKRCLQLTITITIITAPVPWFDTYSGGYCS